MINNISMKIDIGKVYQPKFFHIFNKGYYNKDKFVSDIIAGIIV